MKYFLTLVGSILILVDISQVMAPLSVTYLGVIMGLSGKLMLVLTTIFYSFGISALWNFPR